jgi:AraC-like DNA-binding protein
MTQTPQRLAATPQSASGPPSDVLRSTLEQLRLEGALFFRSELTDAFAFESAPLELADSLRPGADRLILFHIMASGTCWVAVDDGVRHWAQEGDVIVLPYADRYTMGGQEPAETVSILDLLDPLPWDVIPVIRHGGGGRRTDVVCGYLYSEHPLFDRSMRALPPVFVVRLPPGPAAGWVQASISYAMEEMAPPSNRSTTLLSTRLPELVLIEVLRVHLSTAPSADQGWLAALRDPVLAPALALLHRSPERRWTVAELASGAAVSRSLLDERFRQVLGRSPIRYLTEWRMHLAADLLATADITVFDVARRVGYVSEEAFSRAFKRERGLPPSQWRNARLTGS